MVYYSQIILLVTFNILINSKGSVLLDESLYCFRLLLFCQRTSGKILTQHREDKIKCLKLKGQIETPGVICSCLHIDEKMRRPGCGGEISPESNTYVCREQAWLF